MNQFRLFFFVLLFAGFTFQSCEECVGDVYENNNGEIGENGLVILQPNAEKGKDAVIWTERPDRPDPDRIDFQAMGWTWYAYGFDGGVRRSLIEFDLSAIPVNAQIVEATLSLYYNPESDDNPSTGGHSQRDGSNRSILSRITTDWSEASVTWNNQPAITTENQIFVKASDFPTQDYKIDVKDLIEDMVANPNESFGFMYQLDNENYYRAMIFTSSDHPNRNLHPKLEIEYR